MRKVFCKSGFLLFFFLINFHFVFSQNPWAPSGAKLHYNAGFESWGLTIPGIHYIQIKAEADTLFQGQNCKMLVQYLTTAPTPPMYVNLPIDTIFTYALGGKVFFWQDSCGFKLLYDFAAQVGDTVEINGETCEPGAYDWGIVDSTGTISVNGISLKYYTLIYPMGSGWHFIGRNIERFGNIHSLFPYSGMLDPPEVAIRTWVADLRCYEDSSLGLYDRGISPSCDYISVAKDLELNKEKIDVITAADFWQFQGWSELRISAFYLWDISGKRWLDEMGMLDWRLPFRVSNDNLPSGLYFYEFRTEEGEILSGKLLKSR